MAETMDDLMLAADLSAQKLADRSTVGKRTIVRARHGHLPRMPNVRALASVLGVTPDQMLAAIQASAEEE